MRVKTGTALTLALLIWASVAEAGETLWGGAVRVIDAKTLAGLPDGPVLPLGGIEPPPPDAGCGPAEERRPCRELAVQVLRDATAGQQLVCERDGAAVVCRAGGMDVAEWMVRMGWATATDERLREAESAARTAGEGMWYEQERFAHAHEAPPGGYVPPPLPGEDAVRACAEAGANAFARREYGNLMAIEAVEWLIEESRFRWERRNAAGGSPAEPTMDAQTRETLNAAHNLCGVLGGGSERNDASGNDAQRETSGEEIEVTESRVQRLADDARETCWAAAAGAARTERIEDLTKMRQIARHTLRRTERLGERLWQAREEGNDEEARRMLRRADAVFERAQRQCDALAQE